MSEKERTESERCARDKQRGRLTVLMVGNGDGTVRTPGGTLGLGGA